MMKLMPRAQSVSWVFVALYGVYVIGLFHAAAAQTSEANATTDPSEGALLSLSLHLSHTSSLFWSPSLSHAFCLGCLSIACDKKSQNSISN